MHPKAPPAALAHFSSVFMRGEYMGNLSGRQRFSTGSSSAEDGEIWMNKRRKAHHLEQKSAFVTSRSARIDPI
jgi:hypothetical protein